MKSESDEIRTALAALQELEQAEWREASSMQARVWDRLGTTLGPGVANVAGGGGSLKLSLLVRLGVCAIGLGVVGFGAVWASAGDATPDAPVQAHSSLAAGSTNSLAASGEEAATATPVEVPATPSVDVRALPDVRHPPDEVRAAPAARQVSKPPALRASNPPSASEDALDMDTDVALAAEREAIERIRGALRRRDARLALSAIEEHEKRFPRGRLGEERESLRVRALVASDRHAEAQRAAEEFRARFPKSLFLPSVEEAVRTRPPRD